MRVVSSGNIYYYEEDMLGSSRTMVQAGQTAVCGVYPERSRRNADFYPFGGERDITNTCTQNYKFEGKERDTETGNDDFGARYYTSRLGRWLSADWSAVPAPVPYANLTNPQTLNLYAMVSDNPETFADLEGHDGGTCTPVAGATSCATKSSSTPPPPPPGEGNTGDGTKKSTTQQAQQQNNHPVHEAAAVNQTTSPDANGNSGHVQIVYDALGNKLALMNGTSALVKAFAPLPGGGTAVYNASGLQYYRHPDWLGSSRFSSTPSRTMYNDLAYAPFGEQYAAAGTTGITNVSFAGNNQDTTTNLYDAANREYEILGRWPSPDPAGSAAANPANPQSWNRYAYVLNNPLIFTDPTGLDTYPCPTQSDPYRVCTTVTVTGDGGGGDGGGWDGWTGGSGGGSGGGSSGPPCTLGNVLSPVFGHGEAAVLSPVYGRSYAAGCGGWGRGGQNGTPKTTPPQTPAQAATQYCQQHGQLSFNIPFTHVPVTISLSATLGPANYSATNDINAVFPVFPWPEWLAGGASVDFTINAPAQPTANPSVGLGKNLSLGYFTSHNGPQGISLSVGPSIGPPINVAVPVNNACGMRAGGS